MVTCLEMFDAEYDTYGFWNILRSQGILASSSSYIRQLQIKYLAYERSVVKLFSFAVPIAENKAPSFVLVSAQHALVGKFRCFHNRLQLELLSH